MDDGDLHAETRTPRIEWQSLRSLDLREMTRRQYDAAALESLLPHRYPFLLVDRIDVIEPARRVVGFKRLSSSEWWSESQPDIPLLLVLEALAQTSGALVRELAGGAAGAVAYFMGANRVRFRHSARAGDDLRLDVRLTHWRRGLCKTHGIASVGERVVVTAELTTIVRPG
jgi:3-hydroxyacyl-[acyl-carrier-protein] dehydratase